MNKKILLVEDDELMVRLYKRIFTIGGFDVELAFDGDEGFKKAKIFRPDLILLDVMMPKLNGLQTLEKLKNDDDTKNMTVVMLTNLANKGDAQTALSKGAIRYLIKSSYDPKEVLAIVKKFFETGQI